MTSIRSRPRFRLEVPEKMETIKQKISSSLKSDNPGVKGEVYAEHIHLEIPQIDMHFWSPHLNMTLEEIDGCTIIGGRYGPKPTIWTIFLFGYSTLGLTFFFTALAGLVKLSLHQDAQMLWALPFLLIMIFGLYFASQTGQKLGVEQTFRIHHFLEDALSERVDIN